MTIISIHTFSGRTNAACKAHDAAWKSGISLRVTQPARSEPDKVVLDWNSAIENSRCVDLYNVYGKLKTCEDCRVVLFLQLFILLKSTLLYTYDFTNSVTTNVQSFSTKMLLFSLTVHKNK